MVEVQRTLGNEREGGYTFRAKAPCIDGTLNDAEVLERFLAHQKRKCPCYALRPAILHCPKCGVQHVEQGKWATFNHHEHLCLACGHRFPVPTPNVGVKTLETKTT